MRSTVTAQHDNIIERELTPSETGDLSLLAASFRRHLLAENKSPRTLEVYGDAVRQLAAFLSAQGMPGDVADVSREHVESFIGDILTRAKPATASVKFRALQQFFKWAVDEGEISSSPMSKMRPPHIPETPPPVVSDGNLTRLLKSCEGKDFHTPLNGRLLPEPSHESLLSGADRPARIARIGSACSLPAGGPRLTAVGRGELIPPGGTFVTRVTLSAIYATMPPSHDRNRKERP